MRCSGCGRELEDRDVFCPECGLRVKGHGKGTPAAVTPPEAVVPGVPGGAGRPPAKRAPVSPPVQPPVEPPSRPSQRPPVQPPVERSVKPSVENSVRPPAESTTPPGGAGTAPPAVEPPVPAPPGTTGGPGGRKKTSGLAIASLVLGICGFFIIPVIGGILSIIFAALAKKDIRTSEGRLGGQGLANAGLALGIVGIVIWVILLAAGIPIFHVYVYPRLEARYKVVRGAEAASVYYYENEDSYKGMDADELSFIDGEIDFADAPGSEPGIVYVEYAGEKTARLYCYSDAGNKYIASGDGGYWEYNFEFGDEFYDNWEKFRDWYPFD